eukprot:2889192-Rhodomonas_salina.1
MAVLVTLTAREQQDIPQYRVYVNGKMDREVEDATSLWTDDTVGFLLGCSFSWEGELAAAGLCPRFEQQHWRGWGLDLLLTFDSRRHVEEGKNVSMYKTNIPNVASGRFKGVCLLPQLGESSSQKWNAESRAVAVLGREYAPVSPKGRRQGASSPPPPRIPDPLPNCTRFPESVRWNSTSWTLSVSLTLRGRTAGASYHKQ